LTIGVTAPNLSELDGVHGHNRLPEIFGVTPDYRGRVGASIACEVTDGQCVTVPRHAAR
jgi:hypothetical protein